MRRPAAILALITLLLPMSVVAQVPQSHARAAFDQTSERESEPVSPSRLIAQGQLDGSDDASTYSSGKYMLGGFAGGFFGGLIGMGVAYGVTSGREVDIPAETKVLLVDQPPEYQLGYRQSYTKAVQKRRMSASFRGGLIGTATIVAILIASN